MRCTEGCETVSVKEGDKVKKVCMVCLSALSLAEKIKTHSYTLLHAVHPCRCSDRNSSGRERRRKIRVHRGQGGCGSTPCTQLCLAVVDIF